MVQTKTRNQYLDLTQTVCYRRIHVSQGEDESVTFDTTISRPRQYTLNVVLLMVMMRLTHKSDLSAILDIPTRPDQTEM